MPRVSMPTKILKANLRKIAADLKATRKWADDQPDKVSLDIPEPFDHAVIGVPERATACLALGVPERSPACMQPWDECSDIGLFLGALAASRKRRRAKSKPSK